MIHIDAILCLAKLGGGGGEIFAFTGYSDAFPIKRPRGLLTDYFKLRRRRGGHIVSALVSGSSDPG